MSAEAAEHFARFLSAIGVDVAADAEMAETANRFTKLMRERLAVPAATVELRPIARERSEAAAQVIVVRDIPLRALCLHHLMPFVGEVNIAFLPQERMTGFGSLVRLVESMAMGPQLQERLTDGLAAEVMRQLEPAWVAVSISAIQTCVEMSGTGRRPRTVTMSTLGATTPETAWPFVQRGAQPETGA